jgi:hypothetical protein
MPALIRYLCLNCFMFTELLYFSGETNPGYPGDVYLGESKRKSHENHPFIWHASPTTFFLY